MTPNSGPLVEINWKRLVWGGSAAGLIINAFEYGGHRIYLDEAWTAAFRALGKTPPVGPPSSPRTSLSGCSWSGTTRASGPGTVAVR